MEHPPKRRRTINPDEYENPADLERDRQYNDLQLKSTFEDIFEKYSKDFTDVADEIDLETGEIVVDKGHIARMLDEQDVGEGDAGRMLRAFAEDMVNTFSDEDADELSLVEKKKSNNVDVRLRNTGDCNASEDGDPAHNNSPDAQEDTEELENVGEANSHAQEDHPGSTNSPQQILRNRPDAAAIEALGKSIATQIAEFMGQWRQDNFVSDPLWAAPPLPVRTPDRRFTPQSRSVPTRRRPLSPPSGSLWAMQDTYATLRPLNTVARRILHAPTGSRTGERRGEDGGGHERCADSGSTHSDDFEDSSTYLEGYLPTYSANTSIKRRGQQGRQGRQPHHQFSQEDDDLIIQLKNERRPWAEICSHWQDRAPWTIQFRYRKHLKNRIPAAISLTRDDSGVESTDDKLQQSEYAPKERSKTHDLVSPRPSHQPRKISLGIKPSKTLSSPVPPHGATDSNPINGRNVEPRWNQITKYATPRLQARDPSVSSRTGEVAGSSPSPGVSELRESGLSPEIPESMEPGSVPDTLQTRPEIMDSIELSVSPIVADMREPETTNKMVISRRHRTPPKTLEPIQPSIRRRTQETQAKTLKSRKRKASPQVLIEAEEANETASSPQLGNSNQKKYTALNLVNISELIASPQVSKTRNRVRPRSSIKKPNRNSLIRPMTHTPSRNKRTHSEAPSLKHRLQLDEDDSGDELAL